MTKRTSTCTRRRDHAESCGGEIRPSFIDTASIIGALLPKREVTHPATCLDCGMTYEDSVSVPMTLADLEMVADRLSPSTRQELESTATEVTLGVYEVEISEHRASDLASKAANLGLAEMANRVRHELNALTVQRRNAPVAARN